MNIGGNPFSSFFLLILPAATHFLSRAIFIAVYTFFSAPDPHQGSNKLKTFFRQIIILVKIYYRHFYTSVYIFVRGNEGVQVYRKIFVNHFAFYSNMSL